MHNGPKVLMICWQDMVNVVNDGGKKVSNRNWNLLKDVFGEENVKLLIFDKKNKIPGSSNKSNTDIIWLKAFRNKLEFLFNVALGNFNENSRCDDYVVDYINREKVDIVFMESTRFGTLSEAIKQKTKASIWVFSHNLEAQYVANKFKGNILASKVMSVIAEKCERRTIACTDKLITLTKRDSDLNKLYYGRCADLIIPASLKDRFDAEKKASYEKEKSTGKTLLFISAFFNANYDGIKWFIKEVLPELPGFKLRIVGKDFESKRDELSSEVVEVIGTVDDLEPYYYSDDFIVMPIFYGAGQKVKTAEAMMYGKVIFAADEALEGYDVKGVNGIYRCNTKEEFISAITNAYKNGIEGFSDDVRRLFLDKYSYTTALNAIRTEIE